MQLGNDTQITGFTDANVSDDAKALTYELRTADGKQHRFWMPVTQFERATDFLVQAMQAGHERVHGNQPPEAMSTVQAFPMKVKDIGLAAGNKPGELVMSMELGPVRLTFSVPTDVATKISHELSDMVNSG